MEKEVDCIEQKYVKSSGKDIPNDLEMMPGMDIQHDKGVLFMQIPENRMQKILMVICSL